MKSLEDRLSAVMFRQEIHRTKQLAQQVASLRRRRKIIRSIVSFVSYFNESLYSVSFMVHLFFILFIYLSHSVMIAEARQRVPSMPRNVDVTQINASSIRIAWQEPENEGETSIVGYNVYKDRLINGQSQNNMHKAVASVDRNKLYTFIDDLEPNSEYVIRVAAVNEAGDGERSPIKRIVTGGRPPSAPQPQSIRLLSLDDENSPLQARFEWLPPQHTYSLPIFKYIVLFKIDEFTNFERVDIPPSENSYVLENLYHGQQYELRISAMNEIGVGENATEHFSTPEALPDGEPLNIRYNIFKNHLTVLWDPPLWFHRNGNITHYTVVLKAIHGRIVGQVIERNVTSQSIVLEIDPKTSYTFRVAAATLKGLGPYSSLLTINANINTSIGPPTNVRVQAVSNTSVVVQWDFDELANDGFADGFVVKYMHEPTPSTSSATSQSRHRSGASATASNSILSQDKWRTQPVMDSKARHLEIGRLALQKSYAFCVLAIKQSRLGPCSDPPVTLERLRPTFVVQNLHVQYKTSQSVAFHWEYSSSGHAASSIGFYIKQMGMKTYQDQFLEEKTLVSPGFEKKVDGSERQFLWQNLRPYMNYTFQVGVYSLTDSRVYWPRELHVQTDPTGPPFVDAPEFIQSPSPTTAQIRLSCASEEYGPINHYWLIVVPGNYTKEDVVNVDSALLQHATTKLRAQRTANGGEQRQPVSHGSGGGSTNVENVRQRRAPAIRRAKDLGTSALATASLRSLDGVYITAQLSTHQMQRLYREERTFTVGDEREYEGFLNMALEPSLRYSLMTRAFTREDTWRHSGFSFEHRPPMQEPASRLFTDSILTEPFSTRSTILGSSAGGSGAGSRTGLLWLIGPAVVVFVILIIIGMLLIYSCRRGRKRFRGGASTATGGGMPQPVTKVALSSAEFHHNTGALNLNGSGLTLNNNGTICGGGGAGAIVVGGAAGGGGGMPTETSKLLLGMDADGRPIMNAYENRAVLPTTANIGGEPALLNIYPMDSGPPSMSILMNAGGTSPPHGHHLSNGSTLPMNGGYRISGGGVPQPLPLNTGSVGIGGGAIPLTEFATHIDRLKMNNNYLFIQEYDSIETGQHFTWQNSELEVNSSKNRYANVVAYDHSRVILSQLEDVDGSVIESSDYINANYIDGYNKPRAYIATQGPLPETFADFWRMVWEERSAVIVMLTRLEERQRAKCGQYWPSRGTSTYGFFRVTLQQTVELAHYCIRTLRVEDTRTREHRDVQQAQFTAWPDHGVPNHPTPFLMFLKRVKAMNTPDAGPIVIHCSAGIGRTGAFIVIDCMLERLRNEYTVDIYGCVKAIRAQRSYMVQTDDQYVFIHDAVLDAAQSGSTEVPSAKLAQHVQVLAHPQRQIDDATGMEIEFSTLVTLKASDAKCVSGTHNETKNRQSNIVPYDWNRVVLPTIPGLDSSHYINASWIDGYRHRNEYIATQAPLATTCGDFWRMIWVKECCIIANLTQLKERNVEPYWPAGCREDFNNGFAVDCVSEFNMTHYVLREFQLSNTSTGKTRTIRQFHFMEWPDRGVPHTAERFVDYVREVHQTKLQFGVKGPICVHCSDGAGRTGVFITAATIIDRIRHERVVDIFTAVKLLRVQRAGMVETREQYEFCYQAAIEFLSTFDDS